MIHVMLFAWGCALGGLVLAFVAWGAAAAAAAHEFRYPHWNDDITEVFHQELLDRTDTILAIRP